jgi:hypothetical protein
MKLMQGAQQMRWDNHQKLKKKHPSTEEGVNIDPPATEAHEFSVRIRRRKRRRDDP